MRMTIKIVSFSGKPLDGAEVQFDERGGTIGRRVDCSLVIPDKERHVSRVHAVVTSGASGFVIHDQGSFLPVRVNGMEIGFGQEALLCEGDDLLIGPFGLRVLDMENDWDAAMRPGSQLGLAVAARSAAGNPGASRLPETDVALSLMETDLRRPPAAPEVDDAPPSAPDYPISASPDPGALAGSTKPKSPARKRTRRRQAADPEAEHRAKQVPDGGIGNVATAPGPALENAATRVLPGSGGGASASEDPALSPNDPGPMMTSTFDLLALRLGSRSGLEFQPFLQSVWDQEEYSVPDPWPADSESLQIQGDSDGTERGAEGLTPDQVLELSGHGSVSWSISEARDGLAGGEQDVPHSAGTADDALPGDAAQSASSQSQSILGPEVPGAILWRRRRPAVPKATVGPGVAASNPDDDPCQGETVGAMEFASASRPTESPTAPGPVLDSPDTPQPVRRRRRRGTSSPRSPG